MALPVEYNVRFQPLQLLSGVARLAGIGLALLLAFGALLVATAKLKGLYDYHFGFDRQEWQSARGAGWGHSFGYQSTPRAHMWRDVVAHHLRPGLTRAQVLAELGPDDTPTVETPPAGRGSQPDQPAAILRYYVGNSFFAPIYLYIWLDTNGQVRNYHLVED